MFENSQAAIGQRCAFFKQTRLKLSLTAKSTRFLKKMYRDENLFIVHSGSV